MDLCDAALDCLAEREDWISTQIRTPLGASCAMGVLPLVLAAEGLQSKDSLKVSFFDHRVPVIENLGIDLVIVDFVSAGVE